MAVGDFKHAVEAFEKTVELDEKNSDYYYWLGNAFGSRINEVNMLSKMRMAGKIKSSYEKAVELDPENVNPKWGLMLFHLGAPAIAGGSKKKAEELAGEIKEIDPNRGHRAFIAFYRSEQKPDLLIKEISEAMTSFPEDLYFHYQMGYLYIENKEYNKGFEVFGNLIKENPENYGALYQFAKISALSGERTDKGIEYMEEYLKHEPAEGDPPHSAAYWRLGLIYEKRNELDAAVKSLEKALELDPEYKQAKDDLKRIREKKY
jgi:tetratricopeptide (TPR) repeat protein